MLEITQQQFDTVIAERDSLRRRLEEEQDREAAHMRQLEADKKKMEELEYKVQRLDYELSEANGSLKKMTGIVEGQKQGMETLKDVITEISSDLADRIRHQ